MPNVSIGFQIYDSYFNARMTLQNILRLLSNWERTVPNFICDKQKTLMAIIGGRNSDVSLQMATMLDIYKIPQVQLMSVNVFCGMNVFIHGFEYKLRFNRDLQMDAGRIEHARLKCLCYKIC